MSEICPRCGLPKELCVCDTLAKETENRIKVYTKIVKFNKKVTVIEGIPPSELESTAKSIKKLLACGGTYREDKATIELQGDHKSKIPDILSKLGYQKSNIEVL
ncbi:MAG: protein translation factor SUI1 [Candidatus Micrarchaeota archaeon]|nr:MAG: protein translation factor SUI1 [Candidatus Micrarchaeota archaeon]